MNRVTRGGRGKPSFRAASARRSSRVTNGKSAGRSSLAARRAASCNASAALSWWMPYRRGSALARPNGSRFARIRSSKVRTGRAGKVVAKRRAVARWMASRVRTGSTGKGSPARIRMSVVISSRCQSAEASLNWPRSRRISRTRDGRSRWARASARWVSRSVREEQRGSVDSAMHRAILGESGSPKSQRITAEVSRYTAFNRRGRDQGVAVPFQPETGPKVRGEASWAAGPVGAPLGESTLRKEEEGRRALCAACRSRPRPGPGP